MSNIINKLFPRVCIFFMWSSIVSVLESLKLSSYQELPRDGEEFTLTCDNDTAKLLEVKWLRNSYNIFKSKSGQNMLIFETDMSATQYQSVSDRVSVSATLKQHNVTLTINSSLDDGSKWRCLINGTVLSDELTINVFKTTTASSPTTTHVNTPVHDYSTSDSVPTPTNPVTVSVSSSEENLTTANTSFSSVTGLPSTVNTVEESTPVKESTSAEEFTPATDRVEPTPADEPVNVTYIVAGCIGGTAVVLIIIIIIACIRRKKQTKQPSNQDQPAKEYGKEESDVNVEEGEEVMSENSLYVSYTETDRNNKPRLTRLHSISEETEDPLVNDVYAKVQKKENGTDVQVNNNIEDLYAKPVKKKEKEDGNASINMNSFTGPERDGDNADDAL